MTFLTRLFAAKSGRDALQPLYGAVVARGREPHWYRAGGVPDTLDGRFDVIAALLAIVLLRLEQGTRKELTASVRLTEIFIDDMEGSLRQIGVGDLVVGKHVGNMVSALGGRLAAFREGFAADGDLTRAVSRNLFRDAPPSAEAVSHVEARLRHFRSGIAAAGYETLLAGELPPA